MQTKLDQHAHCLARAAECRALAEWAVARLAPVPSARADFITQARDWIACARTIRTRKA